MRALVLDQGNLSLEDIPEPELLPGFETVQVKACGICGSDLRYWAGDSPWAVQTLGEYQPSPPRMVLGHELAGVVNRGGQEQRVAVLCFRTCGVCYSCRQGRENLCADTQHLGHSAGWEAGTLNPGGFAQRCPVWSDKLYPLPAGLSLVEATLLDALGVAVHAVRRGPIFPGAAVAIIGAGPVGLLIMQVAAALGAGRMVAVDPAETARAAAHELGAHACLNPQQLSADDLVAQVQEVVGESGVEAVFESSGQPEAQELGLRLLAPAGRMVLMAGWKAGELAQAQLAGERQITTSANFAYPDFQMALDLLAAGRVKAGPIITHVLPLDEAVRAFEIAAHKEQHGALKVVITPGEN